MLKKFTAPVLAALLATCLFTGTAFAREVAWDFINPMNWTTPTSCSQYSANDGTYVSEGVNAFAYNGVAMAYEFNGPGKLNFYIGTEEISGPFTMEVQAVYSYYGNVAFNFGDVVSTSTVGQWTTTTWRKSYSTPMNKAQLVWDIQNPVNNIGSSVLYLDSLRAITTAPAAVPEPGTILAALSVLAPAGFAFRRKRG